MCLWKDQSRRAPPFPPPPHWRPPSHQGSSLAGQPKHFTKDEPEHFYLWNGSARIQKQRPLVFKLQRSIDANNINTQSIFGHPYLSSGVRIKAPFVSCFNQRDAAALLSTQTLPPAPPHPIPDHRRQRRHRRLQCSPLPLLVRLCTVLHQQHSPDPKLHSHLQKLPIPLSSISHELFLQVCNRFPLSWKPVHRLHLYLNLSHTPTTLAKLLDALGCSRNIQLLFDTLLSSTPHLITPTTLCVAARSLGEAREVNKCAQLLRLVPALSNIGTLNLIVESLYARRLVDVAKAVVSKLRPSITPDEATYRFLILGFCRAGDMEETSRLWNRMVNDGLEPDVDAYCELVTMLFKNNRVQDAMRMFKSMRDRRFGDMTIDSYNAVINWVSKQGKVWYAYMVLVEMLKRGIGADNQTMGDLVYALLARRRVREGYRVVEGVTEPDIAVYHGLMKGFLRLRRAGEATQVLRVMIARGCEPNMHTYIMLLQGHLGKKGRKGRDPLVNFESIFVGGLVKAGRMLAATKYVERMLRGGGGVEVPRFDYNSFLHCFSDEDGVVMFEEVGRRLREVGLVDLGDVLLIYGERMATRDRRRKARLDCSLRPHESSS